MGRKNSLYQHVPSSVLRQLDRLIMENRLSVTELHDWLAMQEEVESPPSRTSVWRYMVKEKETKAALRESREIARGIAQELGPESVESEQGRILVEMLRSFVFKAMMGKVSDPDAKFDAAEIAKITRSVRDLAQAMSMEQDFAKRIREEARKEVEAEVKVRVNQLCNIDDLKKLSNDELKRKIAELAGAGPA